MSTPQEKKETERSISVNISTTTLARVFLVALAIVLLFLIRDVIIILFFSVIIASGVNPVAGWFQRRGIPRTLGVFLTYIGLFLLLALILFLIITPISQELMDLSERLPALLDRIALDVERVQTTSPYYEDIINTVQGYLADIGQSLEEIASNIFAALTRMFGGLLTAIFVIVISFYLAVQEQGIPRFLRAVTPARHQPYILNLWSRVQTKLGKWIIGQFVLSAAVGGLVFVGLAIFGIPFKTVLALLAAVFELIPIVGPILAAIPAVLLAFLKSPIAALWTIVVYVVVQQFESAVLTPKIMERAVGLNPIVVIISLLIGAQLLGFAGILLAVPVAAVVVEIMKDFGNHETDSVRA